MTGLQVIMGNLAFSGGKVVNKYICTLFRMIPVVLGKATSYFSKDYLKAIDAML